MESGTTEKKPQQHKAQVRAKETELKDEQLDQASGGVVVHQKGGTTTDIKDGMSL